MRISHPRKRAYRPSWYWFIYFIIERYSGEDEHWQGRVSISTDRRPYSFRSLLGLDVRRMSVSSCNLICIENVCLICTCQLDCPVTDYCLVIIRRLGCNSLPRIDADTPHKCIFHSRERGSASSIVRSNSKPNRTATDVQQPV